MNRQTSSPQTPSICFIVPFFDEKKKLAALRKKRFPNYFEHFLGTFYKNKTIALKIFTNVPIQQYQHYCDRSSISFHQMSLKSMFKQFKQKLQISGFGYEEFRAYKMCDYKPMFGLVFSDYLKGFDYWGYCDIDMVMGNLEKFLSFERLEGADVISGTSVISGYMTLYRNDDAVNHLFQRSPDYLRVINSAQNFVFDEHGNDKIVAMKHLIHQNVINFKGISDFVHNDCGSNNVNRDWKYLWQNGRLIDHLTHQEIGALHFVKSKKSPSFTINAFQRERSFLISSDGFSPCTEPTQIPSI